MTNPLGDETEVGIFESLISYEETLYGTQPQARTANRAWFVFTLPSTAQVLVYTYPQVAANMGIHGYYSQGVTEEEAIEFMGQRHPSQEEFMRITNDQIVILEMEGDMLRQTNQEQEDLNRLDVELPHFIRDDQGLILPESLNDTDLRDLAEEYQIDSGLIPPPPYSDAEREYLVNAIHSARYLEMPGRTEPHEYRMPPRGRRGPTRRYRDRS